MDSLGVFCLFFYLFRFQWIGKHPVKLNITITTPWLKFLSSQNLVWAGGFTIFHLRLKMVFENSLKFSENLAWISKLKKKSPYTYIPHNKKQHSAKLLLNMHKWLIMSPYIYVSCFVCLTLPAYVTVQMLCYCEYCCFLGYCFYFLRRRMASSTWEGVEQSCMWLLAQPFFLLCLPRITQGETWFTLSTGTILWQLQRRKKAACFSLHLFVSVEVSQTVSFLTQVLSSVLLLFLN